jgi:hypothetical protein
MPRTLTLETTVTAHYAAPCIEHKLLHPAISIANAYLPTTRTADRSRLCDDGYAHCWCVGAVCSLPCCVHAVSGSLMQAPRLQCTTYTYQNHRHAARLGSRASRRQSALHQCFMGHNPAFLYSIRLSMKGSSMLHDVGINRSGHIQPWGRHAGGCENALWVVSRQHVDGVAYARPLTPLSWRVPRPK